ncbi:head-tail connector protein [Nitratireductor sp. ZSWI3]|uniref:head-tail connector protein n=1 Tax=Nitratireductor sp. ZSWI3 TaxID=2966359 RepID=UPI00214FDDCE|nr:head-tail connector protein [Nitratireductor sp. ZSWI3]MCR4265351.1 head-tail connector protein [Nitratireductor sp. ZSWI3]
MTLFRTVDPAVEPLTLAEAKAHLRIDHASEDDLLGGLLRAARQEVEKATGQALIEQAWRLVLDDWPETATVLLRRTPVRSVLSVTVFDADGAGSVLDPADYQLDAVSTPARLLLGNRPGVGRALNGIEIDFTAGYGEAGADVPDLLKRAILLLVAHWYEFRVGYGAADQPVSLPEGYRRLISTFRTTRL